MTQKFNDGTENAKFSNTQEEFQIGHEATLDAQAAFVAFEAEGRAFFNVEVCIQFNTAYSCL